MADVCIGIDCGYRNLALCALVDGIPERWTVTDICPNVAQPSGARLRLAMVAWLDDNADLLCCARRVTLETQMRKKFIALNNIIVGYCAAFDVPVEVLSPKTLCTAFGFPRTREEKKRATMHWAAAMFPREWAQLPHDTNKLDDLADACAMAWYGRLK